MHTSLDIVIANHTHKPPTTGWLIKEGRIRRKRFFVLTEKFQLRYYKSEDTRQPVAGTIHLNW